MSDIRWSVEALGRVDRAWLSSQWNTLARERPVSIFQSWLWVDTWLKTLPSVSALSAVIGRRQDQVVSLSILGRARLTRRRVISSDTWLLAEVGNPLFDTLTVEHNSPVTAQNIDRFSEGLIRHLSTDSGWDELALPGVDVKNYEQVRRASEACGFTIDEYDRKPYYWVELDTVRASGKSYLNALSSNTRYQIRRAMRAYEKFGPLAITAGATLAQAKEHFGALERLHQQYWTQRGQPGAFGAAYFGQFHGNLIDSAFGSGEVEILRITAGERDVGYLYNFVVDRCVYSYQSGFAYDADPHLKPGLVSHALAIERALQSGQRIYDLLAGKNQYKQSLATDSNEMVWMRLQRPRTKFKLERMARKLKDRFFAKQATQKVEVTAAESKNEKRAETPQAR